jgi:hypothetical protein
MQTFAIVVWVLFTNFVDTDNCYFIPIVFSFLFFALYLYIIIIISIIMRLSHPTWRDED